ncbi:MULTISPECIES: FitA-like ribbon-helix-helix domain-containing protein [Rhizobium]|uniref:Plasmid stability protein n=1 Tax=Rhizobium paranaense TaxID=1650438 RepID=A0A7W8XT69_9HYPH|nr:MULTISPECIES: plasmid stabilization protein [Rhizobium]MBB5575143.1 plasmid stability protein [Rhizobium paranaense]PST64428.1 plasmid stabilization protein [Rhizobium sp. SEMIA4064]
MGDLLLRGLDDALKKQLQANASLHGRSLSEEAIALLRQSLGRQQDLNSSVGQRLRAVLGAEKLSEEEIEVINAFRHAPDREPPRFE